MNVNIGKDAYNLILNAEISDKEYYEKFLKHPSHPSENSGVTIGVGYDLRFSKISNLRNDWGAYLTLADLEFLTPALGIKGTAASEFCAKNRKSYIPFVIPYDIAIKQFNEVELPKQIKITLAAYPNANELTPNAFGALVSVVFNRGNNLSRVGMEEMKAIKDRNLITNKDYGQIAQLIDQSKRIWVGTSLRSVAKRRELEAALVMKHEGDFLTIKI